MEKDNHTKSFNEWWFKEIKEGKFLNDPVIRKIALDSWNESIKINNEVYMVIDCFPKLNIHPFKLLLEKIFGNNNSAFFCTISSVKKLFTTYKSAKQYLDSTNDKDKLTIILNLRED